MSTTVKVWCPVDEKMPEGLSNLKSAPPNWFREDPVVAAELYALERWGSCKQETHHDVRVLDDEGDIHNFYVTMTPRVDVLVEKLPR